MPDTKVSALTAATAPLVDTDQLLVVRGAQSLRAAVADLRTLPTEYTTTTPASPTAGVTLFTRHRARRMLATVGPQGQDTVLQPALFSNRVSRWSAANNSATPTLDGLAVTNVTAPAAVQNAATNFYTAMARARFSSTATAGTAGGTRTAAQWFLSSTANLGGFFFVCRFGLAVTSATNRVFVGLSTTTTALAPATDPSALLNLVGFASNSAQTTLRVTHNDGTGTATQVDLGANFPTNTAATNFYEVRLFAPSAGGSVVHWSAIRLNDSTLVQGTITTDLPALNTPMAAHVHHSNGTTAAVVSVDLQSLYIESDN